MNIYTINYDTLTLSVIFEGESYDFDLKAGDVGDYWNAFEHKDRKWYDINLTGDENQFAVLIYEVDNGSTLVSTEKEVHLQTEQGNPKNYWE